jgi:hypothetical protein
MMMKRLWKWLGMKSARPKAPDAVEQPRDPVSVKPDDFENNDYKVEMLWDEEVHGRADSQGPRTDILMPDIYADEDVDTVWDLKIPDQPSPDINESAGFNPYDTGTLQKS